MLHRLEKEIIQQQLIDENERVLIGVSGGPDSVALLHALHCLAPKYGWELIVVHVDHQLRENSGEDAQYVKKCCHQWGVQCIIVKVDVKETMAIEGGGVQEVARSLRYDAFNKVASKYGVRKIVLAHHADDQVETVLMHLIRGTGSSGLVGMQMKRSWNKKEIVRPLLIFTKTEIKAYCKSEELHPRTDESNFSTDYLRNRIRLELIPLLRTYNPKIESAVLQLSEIVAEEEAYWNELVCETMIRVIKEEDEDQLTIQLPQFRNLAVALQRRTIKLILNSLMKNSGKITLYAIEQVRRLATQKNPSGRTRLHPEVVVEREYELLRFLNDDSPRESILFKEEFLSELPPSGVAPLPGMIGKMELVLSDAELLSIPSCNDWAAFDLDKVKRPLQVRTRQNGDRMTCFGMQGTKKVKKLLIEQKVPQNIRDRYPIVVSNKDQILWIPGVKRSTYGLIDKNTTKFLYLFWYV